MDDDRMAGIGKDMGQLSGQHQTFDMSVSTDPAKAATYFSDNMSSTTPQNYLTDVSNQLAADIRGHNAKGITMDNALLTALPAYQKTAESAGVTSAATGVISTTA